MTILKAFLTLQGGDTPGVHTMDVIEHEGQLWLVPEWFDYHAEGITMPVRIVSLSNIPHERTTARGMEVVVSFPLPAAVFAGKLKEDLERKYTIVEKPNIRLPIRH